MGFIPHSNQTTQLIEEKYFHMLVGTILVRNGFGSAVNWPFFYGRKHPCTRVDSSMYTHPSEGGRELFHCFLMCCIKTNIVCGSHGFCADEVTSSKLRGLGG